MNRRWSVFSVVNYTLLTLVGFAMIYPFIYILAYSLNDGKDSMQGAIYFCPGSLRWKTMPKYLTMPASGKLIKSR